MDCTEEGATMQSTGNEQLIIVDGEKLAYKRSIALECFPENVEFLF